MNKAVIAQGAKQLGRQISYKSPTILTGLSVAGLLSTAILSVRATPKALSIIDNEVWERYKKENTNESFAEWLGIDEEAAYSASNSLNVLTKKEVVGLTWKCYIPAAIMGSITIGCMIGSNNINLRRNAALASLYSLSETTLKEYQAKVVEQIGEKKAEKIKEDIVKERIDKNPANDPQVIITGKGEILCCEAYSGRYFSIDVDKIDKIENRLAKAILSDTFISLNDVYDEFGLEPTKHGDDVGWSSILSQIFGFRKYSKISDTGIPCLVIDYEIDATYEYMDYH